MPARKVSAISRKISTPSGVLDTLCPIPSDKKERMKIGVGRENGCGMRRLISRVVAVENMSATGEAFGFGKKRDKTGIFPVAVPLDSAYFRLFRLVPLGGSAAARTLPPLSKALWRTGRRDKGAGRIGTVEGGWKRKIRTFFAMETAISSAFARDCPPCPPLPAFLWRGRFLNPPGRKRPAKVRVGTKIELHAELFPLPAPICITIFFGTYSGNEPS